MRLFFRAFVTVFVALYWLTGGRVGGTMLGIPVLIVTMTGRKTGKRRTVPLGFVPLAGGYVVVASSSGGKHPGWYYNLRSNPRISVELKRERFDATAELIPPEARERLWPEVVAVAPAYGRFDKRPPRDIPLFLLRVETKRPPSPAAFSGSSRFR